MCHSFTSQAGDDSDSDDTPTLAPFTSRSMNSTPVASLVHQIVQSLVGYGYGQQDFATVIELQARASGLELVSEDADVPDGLEPAGANEHDHPE